MGQCEGSGGGLQQGARREVSRRLLAAARARTAADGRASLSAGGVLVGEGEPQRSAQRRHRKLLEGEGLGTGLGLLTVAL